MRWKMVKEANEIGKKLHDEKAWTSGVTNDDDTSSHTPYVSYNFIGTKQANNRFVPKKLTSKNIYYYTS